MTPEQAGQLVGAKLQFATPETIKQPSGGLVLEPVVEGDYILGANDPKNLGEVLVEDGHWEKFLPEQEIQRVRDGDTFCCVTFSNLNVMEMLHKRKYGYEINGSDMFLGVGSGTKRGVGNGLKTVAEWKRKNGFVYEADYPYSREMNLDTFYATIPAAIYAKGKAMLQVYETGYMTLGGSGQQAMLEALKVSPVQVAIEGVYVFDGQGRIKNAGNSYSHAVLVFDYVLDANGDVSEYWVFDSETEQYLRFTGSYFFASPYIHFLKKKTNMFYKKIGEPAICFKHWSEDSLVAFGDGVIPGGDLLKSLFGISKYSELPRENVAEWPYPIKYVLNTSNFQLSNIE